jgi:chromosome partitioning protein
MTDVIACAGQKGGVGKSAICQAIAVEAARAGRRVVLLDEDVAQRTSFEWARARRHNGFEPAVEVVVVDPDRHPDFGVAAAGGGADLVLVDAPGWSDETTLRLAALSDLTVLPTGASVADLRPTIRLLHELVAAGVGAERIVVPLYRVASATEIKFARGYLAEAGFAAVEAVVRDMATYRTLQNQGRAASEAEGKLGQEARALVAEVLDALARRTRARSARPERYVPTPERFHVAARREET